MSVETLVEEYQQLNETDRQRFLELIHPFDESSGSLSEDWLAEIENRWESYKNGESEPIDGLAMEKRLLKEYGIQL